MLNSLQMDLAVALSQSASEAEQAGTSTDLEEDDVDRAKRLSLTPGEASSTAEALSFALWDNACLDYRDRIGDVDGFYDVWGSFPELQSGSRASSIFPSLKDLKEIQHQEDDEREVPFTFIFVLQLL